MIDPFVAYTFVGGPHDGNVELLEPGTLQTTVKELIEDFGHDGTARVKRTIIHLYHGNPHPHGPRLMEYKGVLKVQKSGGNAAPNFSFAGRVPPGCPKPGELVELTTPPPRIAFARCSDCNGKQYVGMWHSCATGENAPILQIEPGDVVHPLPYPKPDTFFDGLLRWVMDKGPTLPRDFTSTGDDEC